MDEEDISEVQENEKLLSKTEIFLRAVETKTENLVHKRLLAAARKDDPSVSIEREFRNIVNEVIHAD